MRQSCPRSAARPLKVASSSSPARSSSSSAGRFSPEQQHRAADALFGVRQELVDLGRIDPEQLAASATGAPGAAPMRRRADLEVGLAEHRRRGDEDLGVVAQLWRQARATNTLSSTWSAAPAPGWTRTAPRTSPISRPASRTLSPTRSSARRGHRHAHRDAGAERAIGQQQHPGDGAAEREHQRGAGDAPHVASRVVERRPERHALIPSRRTSTDCA